MTHEQKVRLGIFLTLAGVLFLVVAAFFILPKINESGDEYYIDFRDQSVHGLYNGSLVKYRGVEIGKVTDMKVNPRNLDSVLVYVKVQKEITIKQDMRAVLTLTGLTGQKFVEISGGSLESKKLPKYGEIKTGRGFGEQASDIVTNVETVVSNLNALLSKENQENFSKLLKNVEETTGNVSGIVGTKRQSLENAIVNFEKASAGLAKAAENFGPLTDNLNRTVVSLEADAHKTLTGISDRFSEKELGRTIEEVTRMVASLGETVKKLNGILTTKGGELDVLIDNLSDSAENLNQITRAVSEDPSILIRGRKKGRK